MKRIATVLVFLCLPIWATAQTYPDPVSNYVNDFAEVIDAEPEARITAALTEARNERDTEITVVTIKSIATYGFDGRVRDYATNLFNQWGVGDADKNNGVLMLVSVEDREVFIALGDGYDRRYDAAMDQIFDQYMRDNFRAGDFNKGIEDGVFQTIKRTTTNFIDLNQKTLWERFSAWLSEWFFMILISMCVAYFILKDWLTDASYRLRRCPNCGRRGLHRHRNTTKAATKKEKGEQEIIVDCTNCDYDHRTTRTLSRISSSSGSGGSFGGGSSSGGGGGGRW